MRPFTLEDGAAYITALESGQEFDLSPFRQEVAQRAIEAPSAVLAALKTRDLWGGAGIDFETVLMRGIEAAVSQRQEREAREINARVRAIVESSPAQPDAPTSGKRETDPTRTAIETAIRALPIAAGHEGLVVVFAAALAQMVYKPTPVTFRPANGETIIEKQLIELRDRATRLARKIEHGGQTTRAREQLAERVCKLSADAIDALGQTTLKHQGTLNCHYVRNGLADDLERDAVSAAELRILADAARAALAKNHQGSNAGREPHHHARAVARVAARTYTSLSGHKPAISGSSPTTNHEQFVKFVQALFIALNVRGDPDYHAVQAVRSLKAAAGNGKK